LKIDPDSVTARVNLGGALLGLKQYERALNENIDVLAIRPHDALAHAQAGLCLFNLNRYEDAIPHLQEAKQSDPNSLLFPGYFLAMVYDALRRNEAAVAEYEDFLQSRPRFPNRTPIEARLKELKK